MAIKISIAKGNYNPSSATGLTLGEPAFNYANNTLWMGKGGSTAPVWIGAGICGASGGIAAGLTYQIPTLGAVKDYVAAVGGGGGAVSSVSGSGNGISVSPTTGAVVVSNTGVHSVNGQTGAVGGVCAAQANTFTALQTFTTGISADGGITFNGPVTGATATFTRRLTASGGISASGGMTLDGGKVWHSLNDGAGSGLDADAVRGVSGDRLIEEIQTGLLYGGVLTINAGNTAAVDVSAGAGIIVTVNASTGGYPAPSLQTIQWTAKTGVTLAGMTSSDFTFFRVDSSGNLQQSSNNFTQTEYLNSVVIGNAVHQSRAYVNRVHYHPIVAYASSAQYETFIRYFGGLKVDGYVMSGYGTTGGIQHTTGTAFALGANMDVDPNNPSLVTDSSAVPVQQLFYLYRNAGGTYRTDPTSRTTVNFGNYDDGDGTLGNVGNQSWSIQRVYKIPGLNNALYIYYGTAVYSSLTVASNNILLESFAEADITRYNGVFLGWLIVRGNGSDVSSSGDCRIVPGGFFRNTTGGGGASTVFNLDDLGDVAITSVANNQILRYDSAQGLWVNSAVTTLPLVTSFNGLTGTVGITAGSNITITQSGNTFTISAASVSSGATATYAVTTSSNANALRYLTFATGACANGTSLYVDDVTTPLSYTPFTGTLNTKNISLLSGAETLTIATNQLTAGQDFYFMSTVGGIYFDSPNFVQLGDVGQAVNGTVLNINPAAYESVLYNVAGGNAYMGINRDSTSNSFALEVNSGGNALQLMYSTQTGAATTKADFVIDAAGKLTIAPSGVTLAVTGNLTANNLVYSFNGRTGAVQGVSAAVAGTGISVSGATGSVTITNTGVQSFNGSTGAVTGVSRVNGLSGGITLAAGTGITLTASGNTITVASAPKSTTQTLDFSESINGLEIVAYGTGESFSTSLRNIEKLSSISVTVNGYTCKLVSLKSFYDAVYGWSARVVVKPPFAGSVSAETIYLSSISSVGISGYDSGSLTSDTWSNISSSKIYHQDATYVTKTVTGQTWVAADSYITCKVLGITTADHTAEDAIVEGVQFEINNIVAGTGFDIMGYAPEGTYGKYTVKCIEQ